MSENIWVVAQDAKAAGELCAGAQALGGVVHAVLLGCEEATKAAAANGAQTVVTASTPAANTLLEGYADALLALFEERGARLVMVQASTTGRLLAGKLASGLHTSALGATTLALDGEAVTVTYLVYGGTAVCTRRIISPTAVVTVGGGVFEAANAGADSAAIEQLTVTPNTPGITLKATAPKQGEQVNLSAAKRVIGVGRGFGAEGDLDLARSLATLIGAELACSRPITEGEDWMARERYIGVSGAVLKPDLYVAIGISGQVQHMVGVNQARTIVAINKDKNAPVFKQADVGIVGDLYTILPALTAALR
ncbi:MAG: FAD-binding protein [Coriobacteriales bacterium]|jgi:electron transfer flavoprotein alpha subunit|nr:FAD-binding protein [Coriobacteriales bacterium]